MIKAFHISCFNSGCCRYIAIKFMSRKGTSMAAPFRSFIDSCRQMINNMVIAISKLPHTKVTGNTMSAELSRVIRPNKNKPLWLKCHLLNMVSISALPVTIAQPCLNPMNTTKSISNELMILISMLHPKNYSVFLKID